MKNVIAPERIGDAPDLRELDRRKGDGFDVSLLWQPSDDGVYVAVIDGRTHEEFMERIDPAAALDAFHHPYAYRGQAGDARNASLNRIQRTA
jgi:hypothetical protein